MGDAVVETKRARPPKAVGGDPYLSRPWPRPAEPAPAASAVFAEREKWASEFVPWFFSQTGGDPAIEGVPAGHRWRLEYFNCVGDPRTFEQYAQREIAAYDKKGA